jgi:uncharacterized protein
LAHAAFLRRRFSFDLNPNNDGSAEEQSMSTTYTYPGVYIEELPSGQNTITGVSTSIAAFIGWTDQGPVGEAVMVESWTEYESLFGGLISGNYLGYAVYQFFLNGGSQAYIVRLYNTLTAFATAATVNNLPVSASNPGNWGNNIAIAISNVNSVASTFNLQVFLLGANGTLSLVESYTNLSSSSTSSQYAPTIVNNQSNYIAITTAPPPSITPPPSLTLPPTTTYYTIAGTASGTAFGTTVTQTNTGATATFVGSVGTPSALLVEGLSGAPDATHTWTGSGGATFAPSSAPVQSMAALIPGTVTSGTFGPAGETVKQTQPGPGSTSTTAYLIAASPTAATGIATSGFLLVAGLSGAAPNSFSTWVGGTSSAVFTPSASPVPTSAIPLVLAPSQLGVTDAPLLPVKDSTFVTMLLGTSPGQMTGYQLLANVLPMFNLLCVPGHVNIGTIGQLQDFCATYRAFLIVDSPSLQNVSATEINTIANAGGPIDENNLALTSGQYTSNAAYYFPWVSALDPLSGQFALFPPSGFVAGNYAFTDSTRGVWKSPAGIDADLNTSTGLQYVMTDQQNGQLNPIAVNCLRQFPTFGNVIWGARTMAGADALGSQWKYLAIRRLALYIESSLFEGTQWAVFEPNAEPLWGQVRLSIGTFMQGLFLQGAFAGTTPQTAYFVKCDADNNPDSSVALGILNIAVGFAPLYPAEFVVIQIQQMINQS